MRVLSWLKNRFGRPNYSIVGDEEIINLRRGEFGSIRRSEISNWHILAEMIHDEVAIELKSGGIVRWQDWEGDLVAALRRLVPELEDEMEIAS
ncbi:MAG TPA: hypothetical protein VHM91_05530 [Verrucomicrobiales bacterium]|nr:hypothetical protein [Verrucomicrobiales bacterium]